MLVVPPDIRIADDELRFTYVRSSGPGGQNVNKVNSKAVLRWNVLTSPGLPEAVRARFRSRYASKLTDEGDVVIASQRFRDQKRNQEDCLDKLRAVLAAIARAPVRRKKSRPTRASVERRKEKKREISQKKERRRWKRED
jgi:ribosome-associated protein